MIEDSYYKLMALSCYGYWCQHFSIFIICICLNILDIINEYFTLYQYSFTNNTHYALVELCKYWLKHGTSYLQLCCARYLFKYSYCSTFMMTCQQCHENYRQHVKKRYANTYTYVMFDIFLNYSCILLFIMFILYVCR
jgi:hypothetical protein